jgi:hypothetical protein
MKNWLFLVYLPMAFAINQRTPILMTLPAIFIPLNQQTSAVWKKKANVVRPGCQSAQKTRRAIPSGSYPEKTRKEKLTCNLTPNLKKVSVFIAPTAAEALSIRFQALDGDTATM